MIGEGGSGGAVALGVSDRVLMQENAIYSVITPEGCAAILWRDGDEAKKAAAAFKPDARHCLELGVIDGIVPEPARRRAERPRRRRRGGSAGGLVEALDELDGRPPRSCGAAGGPSSAAWAFSPEIPPALARFSTVSTGFSTGSRSRRRAHHR